ncbi:hypothetical protein NPIL_627621 [Nephila pilipes]|uniref:Uncharacterized protein n=1 Tax=Nephila pilipes TaxID=299642 RepID=A0A8X6PE77_NEPPI|nr:hypothetical protein NPIL_627621 [Nephila pilipes]
MLLGLRQAFQTAAVASAVIRHAVIMPAGRAIRSKYVLAKQRYSVRTAVMAYAGRRVCSVKSKRMEPAVKQRDDILEIGKSFSQRYPHHQIEDLGL